MTITKAEPERFIAILAAFATAKSQVSIYMSKHPATLPTHKHKNLKFCKQGKKQFTKILKNIQKADLTKAHTCEVLIAFKAIAAMVEAFELRLKAA